MPTLTSLSVLALSPLLLPAQDAATFSSDVRVVNLFATVRDAQGQLVPNLIKGDFTLEEDGQPQTIRYFSRESGLPLTLGLLVDTSISQKRVLAEERTASYRFLSQVLRPDMDRAFVIHFDRDVELLQDLTESREKLDAALARPQTPKLPKRKGGEPKVGLWALGGTALYDAMLLSRAQAIERSAFEPGESAWRCKHAKVISNATKPQPQIPNPSSTGRKAPAWLPSAKVRFFKLRACSNLRLAIEMQQKRS
jgi:VWFA-related protein